MPGTPDGELHPDAGDLSHSEQSSSQSLEGTDSDPQLEYAIEALRGHLAGISRLGHMQSRLGARAVVTSTIITSLTAIALELGLGLVTLIADISPVTWVAIGTLILIQVGAGVISFLGSQHAYAFSKAVTDLEDLRQAIVRTQYAVQSTVSGLNQHVSDLESVIRMRIEQITALASALTLLRPYVNGKRPMEPDTEILAFLLSPMVQDRHDVLGFTNYNALFNIAVYKWDAQAKLLRLAYRECDNRIERRDRSWKPGEGHVGVCFMRSKPIITEDVANIPEFLTETPELDYLYYRSIAAFPIHGRDKRGEPVLDAPVGVLALTSNIPNHFSYVEYQSFGMAYADILSICMNSHPIARRHRGAVANVT